MKVEDLLSRLDKVKVGLNDSWKARCPAHLDKTPSLTITVRAIDNAILLHCHGGCSTDDVMASMGLKMSDLFDNNGTTPPPGPQDTGRKLQEKKAKGKAYPTIEAALHATEHACNGKHVDIRDYTDADGKLIFHVARFDLPEVDEKTGKPKKTFRPYRHDPEGWRERDPPGKLPLYRLPELMQSTGQVFVPEGEKHVDALRALGLNATTSSHGSGSAHKSDWSPTAGRDIVILPDNDPAGEKYADTVAGIADGLNPFSTVKILRLPGLPDHGDVLEFIEAKTAEGETPNEIRDELLLMAVAADAAEVREPPSGPKAILTRVSDVPRRKIKWLWPLRFACGKISLIPGDPGGGKSHVTLDMTSRVSRGLDWPDGSGRAPEGDVIIMTAEDDIDDTVRPRLEAAGADLTRVHILEGVERINEKDGKSVRREVSLDDLPAIADAFRTVPDVHMLIVDPISAFMGSKVDSHKNTEVRSILRPLQELGQKYGAAIVCVTHLNKASGKKAIYRVTDSLAFAAAARAAWSVCKDDDDPERRLFLSVKNNLGPANSGLAFRLVPWIVDSEYMHIEWEPDPVDVSAEEFMGSGNDEARFEWHHARDWLKDLLADGKMDSPTIKKMSDAEGFSPKTMHKAASVLKLRYPKKGFGGESITYWELPQP